MVNNSTTRFSNRVEDYVKYRPDYPTEIVNFLHDTYGLTQDKLIADIGAGTGISTALFLNKGYRVIAVEPNAEMREKAIELLSSFNGFIAHDGTAENTDLTTASVDAVIAGQAFHWFDTVLTRAEFKRILKPGGIVALIWNERKTSSAFEQEYDKLIIKHARDYVKVDHRNIDTERIAAFFNPEPVHLEIFQNKQVFDFEGLKGRLMSSSYMPTKDDEGFDAMIADLKALFDKFEQNGLITISYDTKVYSGKL